MALTSNRTAMDRSDTFHRSAGLESSSSRFPTIEGFGKAFGVDTAQQKRKVNCYKPMLMPPSQYAQDFNISSQYSNLTQPGAGKAKAPLTVSALKFSSEANQAPVVSSPRTIPGRSPENVESPDTLIKAFPAYQQPFQRQQKGSMQSKDHLPAGFVPTPTGSWTERQLNFDTANPDADKTAKETTTRIGKNGNVVGIAARRQAVKEVKPEETSMDHAAWKFRFKKKWIREELHARRQDFPDDPEYSDPWQDAGDFIVRHGYNTTMQAALMGAARDEAKGNQSAESLSSFENLSFSDDEEAASEPAVISNHDSHAVVLSRAQTLIAMTQKVGVRVVA